MPLPFEPARPAPRAASGLLAACLLLAGCSQLPAPPAPTPGPAPAPVPASAPAPAPVASAVPASPVAAPAAQPQAQADTSTRRLLAAHERLRELPAAELARETARLGEATEPEARIELAMALAQTRSNGDLARALALLEPLTRAAPAPATAAASTAPGAAAPADPPPWLPLARLLHARLQEQRRAEEQLDRQAQQLREQQRRLEQLSNQIDALRAIERSLNTRPAAPPASAPR
jgi:hypothetical protein